MNKSKLVNMGTGNPPPESTKITDFLVSTHIFLITVQCGIIQGGNMQKM